MIYQKYWNLVGEETTRVCLQVPEASVSPLNKTLIALIPKVNNPKEMEDYRLISLCNVIYKIIAKVLPIG